MTRPLLLAGFAALAGAIAVLEVTARVTDRGLATLDEVIGAAVRRPAGRVAALVSWLWVGWHLFVR